MPQTLGDRLAAERKSAGLTLQQLAQASGVSPGMLSDLEKGRSKGSTKLPQIARALKLNPIWLGTGMGHKIAIGGPSAAPVTFYGQLPSPEGIRLAVEWDKLDEPIKDQIREMIEVLVAKQVRKSRRKPAADGRRVQRPAADYDL